MHEVSKLQAVAGRRGRGGGRPRQIQCPSQSSRMYEKLSLRYAKLARYGRTLHRCEALDGGYPA